MYEILKRLNIDYRGDIVRLTLNACLAASCNLSFYMVLHSNTKQKQSFSLSSSLSSASIVKTVRHLIASCDERIILQGILRVLFWYHKIQWLVLLQGRPVTVLRCSRLLTFITGGTTIALAIDVPQSKFIIHILLNRIYHVKRKMEEINFP